MRRLEYSAPVLLRESIFPARSSAGIHRRDASRKVADSNSSDLREGFEAARYATVTWIGIAAASLVLWLISLMVFRYAFSLSVFNGLGAQIVIRSFFGIALGSMILAGITMIKSPGLYVIKGKSTYIARRFGPHPLDFWLGVLVGAIAALAL